MFDRPIRAYSVGSRSEHNKRKMRVDMLTAEHGNNSTSRVRAFSVGSRAKIARSDLYKGLTNSTNLIKANSQDISNLISTINNNKMNNNSSVTHKNQNTLNNNNNNNNLTGAQNSSGSGSTGKKSNSTPLLNLNNTKSNSIDPMDDLMEIDFTKKDDDSLDLNYDPKHVSCYDLMEIDYPPSFDMCGGSEAPAQSHRKKSLSISGGSSSNSTPSRASQPVPIAKRTDAHGALIPQRFSIEQVEQQKDKDGYINMKPVGSNESKHSLSSLGFHRGTNCSSLSSSPTKYSTVRTVSMASPAATQRMPPRSHQSSINTDDYLNMSPVSVRSNATKQSSQQKQPQQHHIGSGSAPDGYMEMSWNNKTHTNNNSNAVNNNNTMGSNLEKNRQSSSSSISSSNENMNYISMNFNSNIPRTSSASSDCSSCSSIEPPTHTTSHNNTNNRNNRLRSLPITIVGKKSPQLPQSQIHASSHSQQPIMGQQPPQINHMHSFTTGKIYPPSYLSLNTNINNPSSALTSSSLSECNVTTPTADTQTAQHSSTIFPFSPNSPNSGANKQIFSSQSTNPTQQLPCDEQKRKCLVDGTTGK